MSSAIELYEARMRAHGATQRTAMFNREARMLERRLRDSLSYHVVEIDDTEREVAVINSDNLNEKYIYSLPCEDFDCGQLVEFADNHWLITEKDANNELYTKGIMLQCNHLLKWVDENDLIHAQWCVVEDGTKYLTGEFEDRYFASTRGDSRIAITIARNEHTKKFGRENRFLIDDPDSPQPLAYVLSKPFKLTGVYNSLGVYKFVLQEVTTTDNDNFELGIADYYKHFPRPDGPIDVPDGKTVIKPDDVIDTESGKKVWL